jgi:hypothetical protein
MFEYYVYVWTFPDATVAYVGKGKNDRDLGAKNESFEAARKWLEFGVERVAYFATEQEAYTYEAQLIAEYDPAFNRTRGLTPKKWVSGVDTYVEKNEVKKLAARGALSTTPLEVATAFMGNMPSELVEETVMFVGDRFSTMLKEFLDCNPNHIGKIILVDNYESEHYVALGKALDGHEGANIEPENKDFLAEDFEQVDYVIMNPPFTAANGKTTLWNRFLDKALTLASRGVYTLMPIRGTLGLEHEVLIERVEFASTPVIGKAIYVVPGAKRLVFEEEVCKFKLDIRISEQRNGQRNVLPTVPFIGISRNKTTTNCSIRTSFADGDGSTWCFMGEDLEMVARLMEEKDFGAMMNQFKREKAAKLGHAASLVRSEVISLLNQL